MKIRMLFSCFSSSWLTLLAFPILFSMSSCTSGLPKYTLVKSTLNLKDFINACYAGSETTGTSDTHVNYTVRVEVKENSSGTLFSSFDQTFNAPAGKNKSNFTAQIETPQNHFTITVTIDASDCSTCKENWCNSRRVGNYIVDAGKPYWKGEFAFSDIPFNKVFTLTPLPAPRNPNSYPAQPCNCKIKI